MGYSAIFRCRLLSFFMFRFEVVQTTFGLIEAVFEKIMARSKSSGRWLKEHFDDHYVKQSQKDGWRSRASYKTAGNSGER